MAKSRVAKNKKLYEALDEEMKNSKENTYEEKLKNLDPMLNAGDEDSVVVKSSSNKKSETKGDNVLSVIAKEVNGKKTKKNELVAVEKKKEKEAIDVEDDVFVDPISFTDKLSVEEILRAKIEQQQKLKSSKKNSKKSPTDDKYTASMMQERIKQHEGINIRKEAKIKVKNNKWLVQVVLILALITILVLGVLLILKVIKV